MTDKPELVEAVVQAAAVWYKKTAGPARSAYLDELAAAVDALLAARKPRLVRLAGDMRDRYGSYSSEDVAEVGRAYLALRASVEKLKERVLGGRHLTHDHMSVLNCPLCFERAEISVAVLALPLDGGQ